MTEPPIDFTMTVPGGSNGAPANDHGASAPFADDERYPYATYLEQEVRERQAIQAAQWESRVVPAPVDWYTQAPPKRTWLLRDTRTPRSDGVLPLGKVGQIIAEGGAGKTMAVVQLAIAVATGTRWLGALDVASPGRVFHAVGEEDAEEMHRRLYRARRCANAPIPPADSIVVLPLAGVTCPMLELDERRNLREGPFLPWLRGRLASEKGWRLIVVDPLSRFAGPDAETDNAAATRFVQALESVAATTGATVLNPHHTNKLSRSKGAIDGTAGRGSTGLFDGARWQCSLGTEQLEIDDPDARERLGEIVTLAFTKSNYSRRAQPIVLRHDVDNGGALVPLDDEDLAIVQAARGNEPARAARMVARASHAAKEESERATREDVALDAILRGTDPPTSKRGLRGALAATLGTCSHDRADAAIARRRLSCK
jgi:RecA-family ATPase